MNVSELIITSGVSTTAVLAHTFRTKNENLPAIIFYPVPVR